ncbi:hypothetical protein, partial [Paracoccus sp. 228]|uniref:hypothetical protein n=1 Tax=Paracoccus sp. 228 TaxID=1192054 RepID=UPI001E4FDCA8
PLRKVPEGLSVRHRSRRNCHFLALKINEAGAYNKDRPHSAIGYNMPIALHYPGGAASPSP